MEKINLNDYLASNEYPGRGIAVAMAPDGRQMFIGYFIMGRSENSRNRVFDPVPERGGICTMAADPDKLEDPSLIIYNPVLTLGKTHIVTNGDQTDTIVDYLKQGKSYFEALRTREFEQMECEFFCKPGTDLDWFAYWKDYCENWLLSLGIKKEHLRLRDHEPAELAFYSRATTDIEYAFPFTDWGELWGIADRTNYDLSRHQEASGKSLEYFDSETNEHYIPYVIEPSLGCDRVALAFLCEAYDEEHLTDSKGKEDIRTVLHLHPALAPYKCAVLPLSKKLGDKAMEIRNELSKYFMVDYDDTGSIGKRYRREDEIGTPYCITVDFDTVGDEAKGIAADNCVTVRDRDTMEQVRMPISELKSYIESKIEF